MKSGTLSQWIACGQVNTIVSSRKMPAALRPEIRGRPVVEGQSIVHAVVDIVAEVRYRQFVAAPAALSGGPP